MKKQNFIDWIDNEIGVIGYDDIERGILVEIRRKVESGYFDEDTQSKCEKILDYKFKELGIKPHIYHFTKNIHPFSGITIAIENPLTWKKVKDNIDEILGDIQPFAIHKAWIFIHELKKLNIYGVAVCIEQDNFSKRYGRTKAKGKLYGYLIKGKKK